MHSFCAPDRLAFTIIAFMISPCVSRILGPVFALCMGLVSCESHDAPKRNSATLTDGNWHFEFAAIRAYRMNWDDPHSFDRIINYEGVLNKTRSPEEGVALSQKQIEQLGAAVTGDHPQHPTTECFYPHHAFLFYDKNGIIVGHLDVCFKCSKFKGEPEGFSDYGDLNALESLFGDIDIPIHNENWKD